MDITIHAGFLPHTDPDASLAFYRDTLGFEVRNDVGYGGMRWITVGPPSQPGTSIVLHPPAADPGITEDERRTIAEMMAKGTYAIILLATRDLDGVFERLQAGDAEVVQEPTEQPYGVRDCAVRDRRDVLRPAKDVHDLHRARHVGKRRNRRDAERRLDEGIDRHDRVAGPLEIGRHVIGGTVGLVRQADDRHPLPALK